MKILREGDFFGIKKKTINNNGLLISENETTLNEVPWHYHENAYFFYVLKGHVTEINKKETIRCNPGTLIYQNWQEPHQNKDATIVHSLNIEISKEWITRFFPEQSLFSGSLQLINPVFSTLFQKMYKEILINDKFSIIAMEGLVLQSFAEMHRMAVDSKIARPEWVDRASQYLNDENIESISLTSLAEWAGVHPVYLSKTFPKYFHAHFGEYLRKIKIQKAVSLMGRKNCSFTDISYACGFSDQSHFIKCFKEIYGITPSAYQIIVSKN